MDAEVQDLTSKVHHGKRRRNVDLEVPLCKRLCQGLGRIVEIEEEQQAVLKALDCEGQDLPSNLGSCEKVSGFPYDLKTMTCVEDRVELSNIKSPGNDVIMIGFFFGVCHYD